jgi:hypothetical protein
MISFKSGNPLQSILFLALFSWCVSACTSLKKVPVKEVSTTISNMKFLDEYDLPYNLQYQNTTVGGLSGIDYDAKNDVYYLISDDRSEINPSRFYTAKIGLTSKEINSVKLVAVNTLKQENNQPYPDLKKHTKETVDPEAIRYNPVTQQLIWSSEGERIVKPGDTVLIHHYFRKVHQFIAFASKFTNARAGKRTAQKWRFRRFNFCR